MARQYNHFLVEFPPHQGTTFSEDVKQEYGTVTYLRHIKNGILVAARDAAEAANFAVEQHFGDERRKPGWRTTCCVTEIEPRAIQTTLTADFETKAITHLAFRPAVRPSVK